MPHAAIVNSSHPKDIGANAETLVTARIIPTAVVRNISRTPP